MSKPFNIRSKCPSCGERSLVKLVYGFPGDVLWGDAEAGKAALGGCVITGDDARYRCQNCHSDVWPDGRYTSGQLSRPRPTGLT